MLVSTPINPIQLGLQEFKGRKKLLLSNFGKHHYIIRAKVAVLAVDP
jgi:hypothetical protein